MAIACYARRMTDERLAINPILRVAAGLKPGILREDHLPQIRALERRLGPLRGPASYVTLLKWLAAVSLPGLAVAMVLDGRPMIGALLAVVAYVFIETLRQTRFEPRM